MRAICGVLFAILMSFGSGFAKDLKLYFVDVEGGQATLIVTPKGESLLVDTGWPGFNGRDADRIQAAAKKAGIKALDYVLITHHHMDHVGGLILLMDRMQVKNLISHGPNIEKGRGAEMLIKTYDEAKTKSKEIVVKPGDKIPLAGLELEVITSNGEVLAGNAAGGGAPNAQCTGAVKKADDPSENASSVGFVLRYGKFRFLDLGDLTWNKEMEVACPLNKVGEVDLYLSTHHGLWQSNNPALVHALKAKAIVMNNGQKKGGEADAIDSMRKAPGLQGFWQLHYSVPAGKDHNVEDPYIANLTEPGGFNIVVTAKQDGHFTVWNERNKFQKTY